MPNHARPASTPSKLRWFFATDNHRHAVDSHLSPGSGDVVHTLCDTDVKARSGSRISSRSSSAVCLRCDSTARTLIGLPRQIDQRRARSA